VAWYRRHWVHLLVVATLAFAIGNAGGDDAVAEAAGSITASEQQLEALQAELDTTLEENADLAAINGRLGSTLERAEGRLSTSQRRVTELRTALRELSAALEPAAAEPEPEEEDAPQPSETERRPAPAADAWTVTNIVDGDTIDVRSSTGTTERVRIIGIDTPERGECGFAEAAAALRQTIGDRPVTLTPGARDDRDRYGRILRYVDVGDTDAGLKLIQDGYAVARYDSRDGYGKHTREDAYVAADAATSHRCGVTSPATSGSSTSSGSAGSGSAGSSTSSGSSGSSTSSGSSGSSTSSGTGTSSDGVVKKSRSDICHAPGTTYYSRTTNFTPYDTLDACLASGGRLPKG
jgi:micrococcal nuclease